MGKSIFDTGSQFGSIGGSTKSAQDNLEKKNNSNLPSPFIPGGAPSNVPITTPVGSVSQALVADRADPKPTANGYTVEPRVENNNTIADPVVPSGGGGGGGGGYYSSGSGGSGGGSGASLEYMTTLADLYKKQFDAMEKARLEQEEKTRESNNTNASKAVARENNDYRNTANMIERQLGTGLSGSLISQQVRNSLNRANNVHDIINERDTANSNNMVASYNQYANDISTLANNYNNLLAANYSLGGKTLDKYRKYISEIYNGIV